MARKKPAQAKKPAQEAQAAKKPDPKPAAKAAEKKDPGAEALVPDAPAADVVSDGPDPFLAPNGTFKFLVPQDLEPCIVRSGVGRFRPGSTFTWPDRATSRREKLSHKLIPLDEASFKLLRWFHRDDAEKLESIKPVPKKPKPAESFVPEVQTVAEAGAKTGLQPAPAPQPADAVRAADAG